MSIKELEQVLEHFKNSGFKVKKKSAKNKRTAPKLTRSVSPESGKISRYLDNHAPTRFCA